MALSSINRHAQNPIRETRLSNQQIPVPPRSCSPQDKCQFCDFVEASHFQSGPVDPSASPSASTCALCDIQAPVSRNCQSPVKMRKISQPPVCVDPNCLQNICQDCPESTCEECSDHEENCKECVEQCGSECGVSLGGVGADRRFRDEYPFIEPYSDLLGDQTAQDFDIDGRLPELPTDLAPAEFETAVPFHDSCNTAAEGTRYGESENSFGFYDKLHLSDLSMQFRAQYHHPPRAAQFVYPDECKVPVPVPVPEYGDDWGWPFAAGTADAFGEGMASALVPSFRRSADSRKTSNFIFPSSPVFEGVHLGDAAESAQQPAVVVSPTTAVAPTPSQGFHNEVRPGDSPSGPVRVPPGCQWADSKGQPCGKVFELGTDLHEHLKTAHGVKNEVFCRWVGCRFGILGATPHKYANSVERHTWGHSGHRPYKCPTCSEGFAAANVRDEHFANFHLKRKMFSCDMCAHHCTSARNLKRHKDDTHKTERFQCEFCCRNGKLSLFPRGSNLARHFRKCKYVLALFPDAIGAATGKIHDDWFPTGYRGGHQGMDRAKVMPPAYLPRTGGSSSGGSGSGGGSGSSSSSRSSRNSRQIDKTTPR